jgi:AcrR family transcriptional regulator
MGSAWALPAVSERERALLATAELWCERGFEGLSVEAICARAEIDAKTFESLFKNVEAAAVATIEVPLGAVVSTVADNYSPDRSEAESYALAVEAILEVMAANPAYAFVTYIARRQRAPAGVLSVFESGHQFLIAMLDRLWESSALSDQPARAGQGALGGPEAIVRREIAAGRIEQLPALGPDMVYSAAVPFLGQAEALRLAKQARGLLEDGRGK